MKTVYWCPVLKQDNSGVDELKIYAPERVIKTLDIKTFFGESVSRCPAVVNELKNTFAIRSPISFHIDYNYNGNIVSNNPYDQHFTQEYLGPPNDENIHQIQDPAYLFFCEEDLTITQLPPYYEENTITENCMQITGTYNISKWARPVAPAIKFKSNKSEYKVSRGEIICYYKFNTDDTIKLQKFDGTELFQNPLGVPMQCLRYKNLKLNPIIPTPLVECYEAFQQARFKKKLMKYIKDNLL